MVYHAEPKNKQGVHTEKWCITQNPKISRRVQRAKWCITQNPNISCMVHTAKWCTVAILKTSRRLQATKLCTTEYPEKSGPTLDNKMLYYGKPQKEVQGFGEQKKSTIANLRKRSRHSVIGRQVVCEDK
jgi:hypothetical protein